MSSFWAWIYVLLDNLCIILIDLSTAALPRLNRLLADRSLNLLLDAIFHTWLLRSRQIADDPITNTFDRAWAVGMSKLKVSYGGKQCVSPSHLEGDVPGPKARCWGCCHPQPSGADEHWGTCVSFNSGFFSVYAQQWDCWVIWQFYFQFFKESPHCSP